MEENRITQVDNEKFTLIAGCFDVDIGSKLTLTFVEPKNGKMTFGEENTDVPLSDQSKVTKVWSQD